MQGLTRRSCIKEATKTLCKCLYTLLAFSDMTDLALSDLPVAGVLDDAVRASRAGAVIVTAPPGSGKTMLVPAAVLDGLTANRKLVLIQPRRLAARAVARRIAQLRRGRLGEEVGYQVRFDSCI